MLRVLRDDLRVTDERTVGQPFTSLVSGGPSALTFLTRLHERGRLLGWELDLDTGTGPRRMSVSGALSRDAILVVGTPPRSDPEPLLHQLAARDGGQAQAVHALLQARRQAPAPESSEEEEREAGEVRFRSLVENTSDWVWEVDEHLVYTYASPRIRDLLGYEPAEVLGKTPMDLMPEEEVRRLAPRVSAIVAERKPFRLLENKNRRRDGREVTLETSGIPFFGPDGRFRGYRGVDRDITERKQAEEARTRLLVQEQRERDAAQRHAAQLDALLESMTEGVTVVEATGRVALMNSLSRQAFGMPERAQGWTAEDLCTSDLRGLDGRPLPCDQQPLQRALYGERFADAEVILAQRDGRQARLLFSGSAVHDERGEVVLAIAVFRDVTRLRQLEQTRDEYLHLVSHDLRNPLSVITGRTEQLCRLLGRLEAEEGQRATESILKSAQRMNLMLQDLVDSARLESGTMAISRRPVDLFAWVSGVVESVGSLEDRARLRIAPAEGPLPASVDPERLERALVNLLTNALKYSPRDFPVLVRARRSGTEAVVSVADRGVGIPAEELGCVFDRFFRARTGRKADGVGLGLYIARLIVEAHGGRIWAESQEGRGSTFSFSVSLHLSPGALGAPGGGG
ncbi:MAG TPA: PAS domain S-box protein [Myxococcales bacterium]